MSVLAMGIVACDEYDEAIPQANEQKPIVEVKGLEVTALLRQWQIRLT